MKSIPEETAPSVREARTKVDQNGRGINWIDPSAWVSPLVMALLLALLVRMYGVNIPFNDDFNSPGRMLFDWLQGNFGWQSLWQQHAESRLFVPRIIWLIETFTVGWSTKHWMYASVVMCAVEAYLLALLLQKSVWNTALKWAVAGCISLLLLHPRFGPETFLRGSQGIVLVPSLFIVVGWFLYSLRVSFRVKLLAYVILAEISTLTFANGMIVWVLLFPVFPLLHELRDSSKERRSILIPTALACLCAAAGIGSYFVDYRSPPISWPAGGLAGFSKYFFSWTGAGLASIGNSPAASAFGVCLSAAAAACVTVATVEAVKDRSLVRLERTWPWLALVACVFVSGVVNTFTRSSLGINNAFARRYYLITMQMTIGLAGLVPILICYRADGSARRYQKMRLAAASAVLLGGIFYALAGWQTGIEVSHRHYRALLRRKIALSLWREAPFISPLPISQVVPPPDRRVHYLSLVQAGLCPDYSGGWWLAKALKDARSRAPVGEVQVRGTGEKLKAFGWAMHPVARTPFPAVLTVVEQQNSELTPISVDLMNQKGPPLPGRLDTGESFFWMGFSTYPLQGRHASAPAERLLFFAIDPANREAYPIQRAP
jgi:hypothetical protein